MPNVSDTTVPPQSRGSNATKRLIQAAALASALIPLGSVAVEGATISCVVTTDSGGTLGACDGAGSYSSGASGDNLWKFLDESDNLLYTLFISGTPNMDVDLDVSSEHIGVGNEDIVIAFPNSEGCIPLVDNLECVIFEVTASAAANWGMDGYYMEMRWFAEGDVGDSLGKPNDDGKNRIFKSENGLLFDQVLRRPGPEDDGYDPNPDPMDPALGGRGDTFSFFLAGRADVPEPATLLLLGTGVAATLYRRRRRTQ